MTKKPQSWQTYEEVAAYLLNLFAQDFGVDVVREKQTALGKETGVTWRIDAKGIGKDQNIFLIVECRQHTTSKPNQESLAALAYRIRDTGAVGGIIVSPFGIQKGAKKVAKANNIVSVELSAESTTSEYIFRFLDQIRAGVRLHGRATLTARGEAIVLRSDGTIEKPIEI
jgi:hypothetical protein